MDPITSTIISLVAAYPLASSIFVVMGFLRTFFKPICYLIDTYVSWTIIPTDNVTWNAIKESRWFKIFAYLLDWSTSIKISQK